MVHAQIWFDNQVKEGKEIVELEEGLKLEGKLIIDTDKVKEIIINNADLTDLSFGDACLNITSIEIFGNQLTEIKGLENLPKLVSLACGKNPLKKLEIINNKNLETLSYFKVSPDIEVKIQNVPKLKNCTFPSETDNPFEKTQKEMLQEIAKKFGINEKDLEGKKTEEVKTLINNLGEKFQKTNIFLELGKTHHDIFQKIKKEENPNYKYVGRADSKKTALEKLDLDKNNEKELKKFVLVSSKEWEIDIKILQQLKVYYPEWPTTLRMETAVRELNEKYQKLDAYIEADSKKG